MDGTIALVVKVLFLVMLVIFVIALALDFFR